MNHAETSHLGAILQPTWLVQRTWNMTLLRLSTDTVRTLLDAPSQHSLLEAPGRHSLVEAPGQHSLLEAPGQHPIELSFPASTTYTTVELAGARAVRLRNLVWPQQGGNLSCMEPTPSDPASEAHQSLGTACHLTMTTLTSKCKILANVNFVLHEALQRSSATSTGFLPHEAWLELHAGETEPFSVASDHVSIY